MARAQFRRDVSTRDGAARIPGQLDAPRSRAASASKNADHPYADDLDIFGPGSMFQLLSLLPHADGRGAAGAMAVERRPRLTLITGTPGPGGGAHDRTSISASAWRWSTPDNGDSMLPRPADRLGRAVTSAPAAPYRRCRSRAGIRRCVRKLSCMAAAAGWSLAVVGGKMAPSLACLDQAGQRHRRGTVGINRRPPVSICCRT